MVDGGFDPMMGQFYLQILRSIHGNSYSWILEKILEFAFLINMARAHAGNFVPSTPFPHLILFLFYFIYF